MDLRMLYLFLGFWFFSHDATTSLPVISKIQPNCHGYYGDINIAVMSPTTDQGPDGEWCSTEITANKLTYTMASVWMAQQINAQKDILPNLTLGYVVLNTCQKDSVSLAQTLYLVPDTCDGDPEPTGTTCNSPVQEKFKVFGVVGPSSSRESVLASSMLGIFDIPTISPTSSSDVLSDKSLYQYFLRVVPPDRFQVETLISFVQHMGWSYVSVLYSEGSYGENAAKLTAVLAKGKSICIPVSYMLPILINNDIMDEVLDTLLDNIKARVVIVFINDVHQLSLFSSVDRRGLAGTFIFVSGDFMYGREYGLVASGSFVMTFLSKVIPVYDEYFNSLQPIMEDHLWMKRLWEQTYGCEWDRNSERSCYAVAEGNREPFLISSWSSLFMDATEALAVALHNMFMSECPGVFKDKKLIDDCFDGRVYLQYLKNVSFEGVTGKVEFDENGDSAARYYLTQYIHDSPERFKPIAYIDYLSDTFDIYTDEIRWDYVSKTNIRPDGIPESVCSKPCKVKEYAVRQELVCCWVCRTCRENEILGANVSNCELCPMLYWPDNVTQTICERISPVYLLWTDVPCIILLSLCGLGFLFTIMSYAWIFKNWNAKLVKASSRDLSSFTLAGCLLAQGTVFAIIAKPSAISCTVNRIGFNLSVAMIFAPLLLKTNRVYRIFQAGKSGNTKPALIGNRVQMVFTLLLVAIQIIVSVVTSIAAPPMEVEDMKVRTERYVEIYCDLPMVGLLAPLAVNLFIILMCMLFGFLTRKLPENFNETWYIFVSGSTTMFLWVVFLPTYYTTFYATHKAILLAACLIINSIITVVCLFVPKMYALKFLDEELQNAKTNASSVGTNVSTVG